MKKNYFFGKYYKFISKYDFSMAIIIANSNEGKSIQLITNSCSYQIKDIQSIKIVDENHFIFSVNQDDLSVEGDLYLGALNPLSKKVMGPFSYIPFMECKHDIYSMFHSISGNITINSTKISFDDGIGYIEGDKGRNFPKKYIWYNSVLPNKTITLAIARIPFGFISFTGVLCFIKTEKKEYYFCTWNRVKIKELTEGHIKIKKGRYVLNIDVNLKEGHCLKAPVKGNMTRYIKENLSIPSKYCLSYNNRILLQEEDEFSSCEWVY